ATLTDTLHSRTFTKKFYIPDYVPMTDLSLTGDTTKPVGTAYDFNTANKKALGIDYTYTPATPTSIATGNKFTWKVTDPSNVTTSVSDNGTYTPTAAGNYKMQAILPQGVSETQNFTKTFTVRCTKAITASDITISPDTPQTVAWTGSPVKPVMTVRDGDKVLTEGTDYKLVFDTSNPNGYTDVGEHDFTISGMGFYTASADKSYTIKKLPTGAINISTPKLSYTGFESADAVGGYVNGGQNNTKATISGKNAGGTTTDIAISYIKSQTFYGTVDALNEAVDAGRETWTSYSSPVATTEGKNYFYARIQDNSGGKTTTAYVSSKDIMDDRTAPGKPKISSATIAGTVGTVVVASSDSLSGIDNFYVLPVEKGLAAPDAATIMSKGTASTSPTIKVPNLSVSKQYTFYAVAKDKAGNVSVVSDGKDSTVDKANISGKIIVEDHSYEVLQAKQEIDDYYKEQQEIKITAKADYGVQKIEYYITDKYYSSSTALENEIEPKNQKTLNTTQNSGSETETTVNNWSTYNDSSRPYLLRNKLNYIYAKITDKAGYTYYLSSKGIWEDEIAPKVTSNKATPKDKTATGQAKGKDNESGIKYYYTLVKKETDPAPKKAEDVKGAGLKSEDGKYDLEGLTPNTKYVLYTVAEDKAGNLSEIKKSKMTTKKDSSSSSSAAGAGGKGGKSGADGGSGSNVDKRTADAKKDTGKEGEGDKDKEGIRDGVPYIEDATDGILIGRDKTSGWDRIEGEVGNAEAPAQVFINMNGSTEVPADALKLCKDRDVTYYFEMNDDITWAVNGLSFTDSPKTIDFRVRTDTKNIPSKLVNEVADVYPHTNLTIEHDGEFGFTAILSINVGSDNEGMYANLYYYDEEANSLEFVETAEVDGSGRANFEFLHASDYTVILRGDALTDKTAAALVDGDGIAPTIGGGGDGTRTPKNITRNTGSIWLIIVSIISFLLCGLILFVPDKKKRKGYRNAVA
nr:hypothetical protein [Lachnospiraceae bacterium]